MKTFWIIYAYEGRYDDLEISARSAPDAHEAAGCQLRQRFGKRGWKITNVIGQAVAVEIVVA